MTTDRAAAEAAMEVALQAMIAATTEHQAVHEQVLAGSITREEWSEADRKFKAAKREFAAAEKRWKAKG